MRKIRKKLFLLSLFISLALSQSNNCFAVDKIVAVVNNDCITQKDMDDFINFMRIQLSGEYKENILERKIESMKEDFLDRLIEDRLILQEAKKNDSKIEIAPKRSISLKPDESRVKARVAEIRKRYDSEAEFLEDLAKHGLVQADIETKIREQILMHNIVEYKVHSKISVRPEEVTSFYQKNALDFFSKEVRDLDVVAITDEITANTIYEKLKKGESLEELGQKFKEITVSKLTAAQDEELKKEIEEVVFKLVVLEVSKPVAIDDKYYVFRLNSITPGKQLTLQQAQDQIHAFLYDKKMQESLANWLDEIKKHSYIKVLNN